MPPFLSLDIQQGRQQKKVSRVAHKEIDEMFITKHRCSHRRSIETFEQRSGLVPKLEHKNKEMQCFIQGRKLTKSKYNIPSVQKKKIDDLGFSRQISEEEKCP